MGELNAGNSLEQQKTYDKKVYFFLRRSTQTLKEGQSPLQDLEQDEGQAYGP